MGTPSSFNQCFMGSSTYTTCTGTGLWNWILPQLCVPVFAIQQHTQVKSVKRLWKNDTQVMYFESQEMCVSCTTAEEAGAESDPMACCTPASLSPLSLSSYGAWRQDRVCQLLGCLNVLHLCIANLCKIQQKRTNTELHLQSELSFKEPFA